MKISVLIQDEEIKSDQNLSEAILALKKDFSVFLTTKQCKLVSLEGVTQVDVWRNRMQSGIGNALEISLEDRKGSRHLVSIDFSGNYRTRKLPIHN